MTWIDDWLASRRIALSKSWLFSAPDASKDKCLRCAVPRGVHGSQHQFVEKEK
jgi:hypothetical protein